LITIGLALTIIKATRKTRKETSKESEEIDSERISNYIAHSNLLIPLLKHVTALDILFDFLTWNKSYEAHEVYDKFNKRLYSDENWNQFVNHVQSRVSIEIQKHNRIGKWFRFVAALENLLKDCDEPVSHEPVPHDTVSHEAVSHDSCNFYIMFKWNILISIHSVIIQTSSNPEQLFLQNLYIYERLDNLCKLLVYHITNHMKKTSNKLESKGYDNMTLSQIEEIILEGVSCTHNMPLVHAIYCGLLQDLQNHE
jgi:hypothetical protein